MPRTHFNHFFNPIIFRSFSKFHEIAASITIFHVHFILIFQVLPIFQWEFQDLKMEVRKRTIIFGHILLVVCLGGTSNQSVLEMAIDIFAG